MLPEILEERAALYVSGALSAAERESFELVLEFHEGLQALVAGLANVMTACALVATPLGSAPSAKLKSRILADLRPQPARPEPDAVVVTGPGGLVEWVNPAFTAMCGFSVSELQGRKPGELLQGPGTDPAAVERIRACLRAGRACRETLVNYHKDGGRYMVDVRITPILDDERQPLWFVAKERKLRADGAVLAG